METSAPYAAGPSAKPTAQQAEPNACEYQSKPIVSWNNQVTLERLRADMAQFAEERDWGQYHQPRNLLLALTGEVGELAECFQWRGEVQRGLPEFSSQDRQSVAEELSDVLLYLVRLADSCNIDLGKAALEKMQKNRAKYPIEQCRGSSAKYTQLSLAGQSS